MRRRTINPAQQSQRAGLRLIGGLLAVGGAIMTAIGMVSFFSSFGGHTINPGNVDGGADRFWFAFIGLPMLAIGLQLLKAGYVGTITRYVAGETAPVAADTLNYLADETRPAAQSIAASVRTAISKPTAEGVTICRQCGHGNDAEARFCDQCGAALQPPKCPKCHAENDADAHFCDACGERLEQA